MELLKDSVYGVMKNLVAKGGGFQDKDLSGCLKKILTKKELGHIKVKYFKNGVLSLNIDSSPWLYSVSLKKEKLLACLREKEPGLKDIKFFIGEIG